LSTEETEAILWVVSRLDEIFLLQLTDDRGFIIRVLPFFPVACCGFLEAVFVIGETGNSARKICLKNIFPHLSGIG
jgi:hypothetical protein